MSDSPLFQSPGPACQLQAREQGTPYPESPELPGWHPPDWEPRPVAWQASLSTEASSLLTPSDACFLRQQPACFEEEIDRFLRSLDIGSSTQSVGPAGNTSISDDVQQQNQRRRADSPALPHRSRLSPKAALEQLPEEAFAASPPSLPCRRCGRRFAAPRLEVHEAICFSTAPVQREVFESKRQRLEGLAMPQISRATIAQPRADVRKRGPPATKKEPGRRSQALAARDQQELCTPQRRPHRREASSTPAPRPRRTSRSKAPTPVKDAARESQTSFGEASAKEKSSDANLAAVRWERLTRALFFAEELRRLEQLADPTVPSRPSELEELDSEIPSPSLSWQNLSRGLAFVEEASEQIPDDCQYSYADAPKEDAPSAAVAPPSFSLDEPQEEALASTLFTTWVQNSSALRVPPLVAEAAELCAEVDALLGDVPVEQHPQIKPFTFERPNYDPRKYCEPPLVADDHNEADAQESSSTELGALLKRCADKIRQRQQLRDRCEFF